MAFYSAHGKVESGFRSKESSVAKKFKVLKVTESLVRML